MLGLSQDATRERRPSTDVARRGELPNGHGTAEEGMLWMDEHPQLLLLHSTLLQPEEPRSIYSGKRLRRSGRRALVSQTKRSVTQSV